MGKSPGEQMLEIPIGPLESYRTNTVNNGKAEFKVDAMTVGTRVSSEAANFIATARTAAPYSARSNMHIPHFSTNGPYRQSTCDAFEEEKKSLDPSNN